METIEARRSFILTHKSHHEHLPALILNGPDGYISSFPVRIVVANESTESFEKGPVRKVLSN